MSRAPKELRDLRTGAGLSLFDVASRLGLHGSGLSLIERGQRSMPDEEFPARYRRAVVDIAYERAQNARQAVGVGAE